MQQTSLHSIYSYSNIPVKYGNHWVLYMPIPACYTSIGVYIYILAMHLNYGVMQSDMQLV